MIQRKKSAAGTQRRRARSSLKPLGMTVLFVALIVLGAAALHMRSALESAVEANPPVSVGTLSVRQRVAYTINERFAGRLEPDRQTQLAFERAGLVIDVAFDEGDKVAAGEEVAELDTQKLKAEKARLAAERRVLEAKLALADATLKRQTALRSSGWQSAQRFDEARFARAEVAADIERVDAAIASIDVDIGKSVLAAPFAGTIGARLVDEGAVVEAGTPILDLFATDTRLVRVGVSVDSAAFLEVGEAYPLRWGARALEGKLVATRPDVSSVTQTVTALFRVGDGVEIPFGDVVDLIVGKRIETRGIWVPISALTEGRKGIWSVYTVVDREGEQRVMREAVEVIHVENERAYVRGTLQDGQRIVVSGVNRVVPGQQVRAQSGS